MSFFSLSLFSTFFRFIPACGCPTTYEITTTKTILIWGAKKFRCCIGILTTVVARYHPSHHIHRLHRSIVFCRHRCRYTHFLPPYHHNQNCTYANVWMACLLYSATINVEMRLVCNEIQSRTLASDVSRKWPYYIFIFFMQTWFLAPSPCLSLSLCCAFFPMSMLIFSCFLLWPFSLFCVCYTDTKSSFDPLSERPYTVCLRFYLLSTTPTPVLFPLSHTGTAL